MKKLKQFTSTKKDALKGGRAKPDIKYAVNRPERAVTIARLLDPKDSGHFA